MALAVRVAPTARPPQRSSEAVGERRKGQVPTGNARARLPHPGSGRAVRVFADVSPAATGSLMLSSFHGMLAGCASPSRVFVAEGKRKKFK